MKPVGVKGFSSAEKMFEIIQHYIIFQLFGSKFGTELQTLW